MPTPNIIPGTVNPDLQKERNAASFNVEEFATWWHGGAEQLKFKRELESYMYHDLKEHNSLIYYKSHVEISELSIKNTVEVARKLRKLQAERNPGGNDIWPALFTHPIMWPAMPAGHPFDVHASMMVAALKGQCTDEQYERFGKRAEQFQIAGAYAQTELGHGTFLRGLETRADYDRKTDEFVLNSPTITAYKWWPGGLGHFCNYCLLVAQLYIDNAHKGVQMFFVQLRDEETHMPLPGIDIGEIGTKMGFYGVNNGYLGLKNVRIPRDNMLMRNAKVLRDGTFIKSPMSQLSYFAMVKMRCMIVKNCTLGLAQASVIATRYSAVRRQSPINVNEPEPQIIEHVTQQLKILPEIATTVAYRLTSNFLWSVFAQTEADMLRGEYSRLPELHALACGLKALCTYDCNQGADRLRMACGGHGYLNSSNMGPLYVAITAACTYEGENTVLLLQVARFLIKSWNNAIQGKVLMPTVKYLAEVAQQKPFGMWTGEWSNLLKAMQYAAANKTRLAYESMSERLKAGQSVGEAANHTGIEFIQAAELHGRAFICATFLEQVCGPAAKQCSAALTKVLENLLELYLVHTTQRHMSDILRCIQLTDAELCALQTRLELVLKKLRPDAVAICDGFDFHDCALSSALGAYDGNVYERLFDLAKQSPLNKQPVPASFHKYLKPFLKSNL